ncbi:hypothetical protein [Streptomyces sp. AB3(2024)]|uniref:hypothetical protein n=1 Tax=Streptomyces sp. AB3(2024) TaxID=3317321 RepID=UPI0035A39C63
MTEKVPLKEAAINAERVTRIGHEIQAVCPAFDADQFAREVIADLPPLALKARIARTSAGLHKHLPVSGAQAIDVLLRSLPATPEEAGITTDFGLHLYSPHSDYVARYCRTHDNLTSSLDALARMTRYFTAEDAARYFIADFPQETMATVNGWAQHPDHRVRRLASESTRPTLPWSIRIPLAIDAAMPVLDQLHTDPSRYVTRSVANHLHDISAERPDIVLATLQRWKDAGRATGKEFEFIAREALRTLLKTGDTAAYEFLGYPAEPPITLPSLHLERHELREGETLAFTAELSATAPAKLRVSYVISSTTLTGSQRKKVYFLKDTSAEAGQALNLSKAHRVRTTATNTIRPGTHTLTLQVNGRRFAPTKFQVLEP